MKIQTFTVVAGSLACNARCPFCIAQMTPNMDVGNKQKEINGRNFEIAARIAETNRVTTMLITSKGEPTLFPEQVQWFIENGRLYFPLIELQTNGLLFTSERWDASRLPYWHQAGLTTIALSVVSHDDKHNRDIYTPNRDYPPLIETIQLLKGTGFNVRLTVTMVKGVFDNRRAISEMISFARNNDVDQLTVRPVAMPDVSANPEVAEWTKDHLLTDQQIKEVVNYVELNGTHLMTLPHGATVYDVNGQNVCLTDCLTIKPDSDDLRQLIFYPDGKIAYDWRYEGARIL